MLTRFFAAAALLAASAAFAADAPNGARIDELTGLKGKMQGDNVYKVELPRNDLNLRIGGSKLPAPMGLSAWAAFMPMGDHDMVMGDLVLTQGQVNPVMSAALDNGLQVTALHNHFFWETPRVMFMHISGTGSENDLATAVGKVFQRLKQTESQGDKPKSLPKAGRLDAATLQGVLGEKPAVKNGVVKFTFGMETEVDGQRMGKAMGVNTWAAFMGSDKDAVVDGDFAMSETQLQNVLKTLREGDIDIVAIHQHMVGESPRILFLHYWGRGGAPALAKTLRAALDTQQRHADASDAPAIRQ